MSNFLERALRTFLRFIGLAFSRGVYEAFGLGGIVGGALWFVWHDPNYIRISKG